MDIFPAGELVNYLYEYPPSDTFPAGEFAAACCS